MKYLDRIDLLQLDHLEVRRIKADLILYYKVINNPLQIDTVKSIRHYNTSLKVITGIFTLFCYRTDLKKVWCNRFVSLRNNLDYPIVNAATLCQFKQLLQDVSLHGRGNIYCESTP